jgi:hypothetical protein
MGPLSGSIAPQIGGEDLVGPSAEQGRVGTLVHLIDERPKREAKPC